MPKVPFAKETAMKCVCGSCPVQVKSKCSTEKMGKVISLMEESDTDTVPKPADVPALYCWGGKAACTDLDMKQMCICGSCPVWDKFRLVTGKPSRYFCRDGKSR